MRSRYCFNPSIRQKIGHRLTIAERIRRWRILRENRKNAPDLYPVTGYYRPHWE